MGIEGQESFWSVRLGGEYPAYYSSYLYSDTRWQVEWYVQAESQRIYHCRYW